MRKAILLLLVLLIFVIGCTQQVGEQDEDFFKDYLKKYLSEEYINGHFEITKTIYDPQYDQNCYTYEIKFGNHVATTGSGISSEVEGIGGPGEIACFRGNKANRYHGPKGDFELKVSQETAESIMQDNNCRKFEEDTTGASLHITNKKFYWSSDTFPVWCNVDAETGELSRDSYE